MALLNTSINLPSNVNTGNEKELKKLNSYLYKLSEELRYMFENITPEDNFNNAAYVAYQQKDQKISSLEVSIENIKAEYATKDSIAQIVLNDEAITQKFATKDSIAQIVLNDEAITQKFATKGSIAQIKADMNGVMLSYVKKGDVVASINASNEGVKIKGNKITLEGIVTANNYFRINADGSMSCTHGTFSGKLTGNTIESPTINGGKLVGGSINIGNNFIVDERGIVTFKKVANSDASIGCHALSCVQVEAGRVEVENDVNANRIDAEVGSFYRISYQLANSDKRLKRNIEDISIDDAEKVIRALHPVSFILKDKGWHEMGFIAQEVEALEQSLKTKLPLYAIGKDGYYGIKYENYIALIVKVLQKLLEEKE
jgi:hypothetical protein